MNREIQNRISYTVACISEFAYTHNLTYKQSYLYLKKYGGITFLVDCYEAEHLLSIADSVCDLTFICKKNGGAIG